MHPSDCFCTSSADQDPGGPYPGRVPRQGTRWLLTLVLLGFLGPMGGCTQLFFQPQRPLVETPELRAPPYRTVALTASDGTVLSAWFFPAQAPERARARSTVLFLHGNAQNLASQYRSIAWMPAQNLNVLALDYRGYGNSQGLPTLGGVQLDIDAAMAWLLARDDVDPAHIIVFGQSLGGALAIYYAAHGPHRQAIRALVVDSAFSDYRTIAREKLASLWLTWPLQWLPWLTIDDDYAPINAIAAVSPIPLLLIQGDQDAVVPVHHAQELFNAAAAPKALWIVPGAGHIQSLGSIDRQRELVQYLMQVTP